MTIEIVTFNNKEEADIEKKNRHGIWRSLHNDTLDGKFIVTFVNDTDDPKNSEEQAQSNLEFQIYKELITKLKNKTITPEEKDELMIIKWG